MNAAMGWAGNVQTDSQSGNGDEVNQADPLYYAMAAHWGKVRACLDGTEYLRLHCDEYLPQQPLELDESYQGRVSRSVFSPYFSKILRVATGLILRKPLFLEGGDESFWEAWREDVCRDGATDLDQFANDLLSSALSMGHSSVLVDYPDTSNVKTLADEAAADLKPYLVEVPCTQLIGWRQDPRRFAGKMTQLRMREVAKVAKGRFGVEYKNRVRVLEAGSGEKCAFELWEENSDGGDYVLIESGTMSISQIPLATVYGQKLGVLHSRPPLLPIAALNISHYQKSSDLTQSLHIAAQPLLIGKGVDDLPNGNTSDTAIGLSVNNMMLIPPDGSVEYVQPQTGAFDAQRADMDRLVDEMKNLGIAILSEQNTTNASGVSKAMDRIDSNSILAVVSKSLQQCLQDAVNLAAEYAGVEACEVVLPRDFNVDPLDGSEIAAINQIYQSGLIDQATALELLQHGEILSEDMDPEEIAAGTELEEQQDMEMQVQRTEAMADIGEGTPAKEDEEA